MTLSKIDLINIAQQIGIRMKRNNNYTVKSLETAIRKRLKKMSDSEKDSSESDSNSLRTVAKTDRKDKLSREPSAYNLFMKKEMKILEVSHPNPDFDYRDRFRISAERWGRALFEGRHTEV